MTGSFLLLSCNRPRSVSFRRPSPLFLPVDQQRGALRGGPHRLRLNLGRKSRPSAPSSSAAEVLQRRLRGSAQPAPAEHGRSAGPPQERHPRPRSQDLGGQGGRARQTGCARGRSGWSAQFLFLAQLHCFKERVRKMRIASCTTSAPAARAQRAETPELRNRASATFFCVLYKIYAAGPACGPRPRARTPGPWEDDGKVHHGPASLPSGKNQTRHLDALDAADKTAAYEGGGGGGGATIIFRVGAVKC